MQRGFFQERLRDGHFSLTSVLSPGRDSWLGTVSLFGLLSFIYHCQKRQSFLFLFCRLQNGIFLFGDGKSSFLGNYFNFKAASSVHRELWTVELKGTLELTTLDT